MLKTEMLRGHTQAKWTSFKCLQHIIGKTSDSSTGVRGLIYITPGYQIQENQSMPT